MAYGHCEDLISGQCWSNELSAKFIISIVDDDESVREALVGLMQSHGYGAQAFESSALFLASGSRPNCLIADMHMPEMTGLDLCCHLTASGDAIPTILITARHDESLRERALKAGVLCYLTKPFKEESLLKCIRSVLMDTDTEGS
jgi:FixJ family two-component response regulator